MKKNTLKAQRKEIAKRTKHNKRKKANPGRGKNIVEKRKWLENIGLGLGSLFAL